MAILDSHPPSLTYPAAAQADLESVGRLIVLFPSSESENPKLSRRIWEIARSFGLNVLLLSLCSNYSEEALLRRKLVTLAAIIKDGIVSTEIKIERGNDWVGQVKNIWRPGDVLACFAGQRIGLMRKPLDQVLRLVLPAPEPQGEMSEVKGSSLKAPIYILSEYQPRINSGSHLLLQASPWLGSFAIIGGFLWAEMKIVQLPHDWAHTTLLYACIFVEIALIWLWNSFFTPLP